MGDPICTMDLANDLMVMEMMCWLRANMFFSIWKKTDSVQSEMLQRILLNEH